MLVKAIQFDVLIKGAEEVDGELVVYGPIAPAHEDYDKDIMTKAGLDTGLDMFRKCNSHVDYGHMYAKTKDPKWLIGRGEVYTGPDGRPWLKTILDKTSEIAHTVWNKVKNGFTFGYSLQGLSKRRDPRDKRKIVESEIHRITIDPSPKGFGNFLAAGNPPDSSLGALAKSIVSDITRLDKGQRVEGWSDTDSLPLDDLTLAELTQRLTQVERLLEKALTTGSGVVPDGTTGGMALRKQSLAGEVEQTACSKCRCKNRVTRRACRRCGAKLTLRKGVSADPLTETLTRLGAREPHVVAAALRTRR